MISQLIVDINDIISKSKVRNVDINDFVVYIISIKYLCENGTYKYNEVVSNRHLYNINHSISIINKYWLHDQELYINKLLKYYDDISARDLLLEFLDSFDKPFKLNNKVSLFIGASDYIYSFYDMYGKTTYIYPVNLRDDVFEKYKLFDKILGISNMYKNEDDVNPESYDYLYIYANTPKYRFNRDNNIYSVIEKYIDKVDNIIMYTYYNKINNVRDCRGLLRFIKTIIIDVNKATVIFNSKVSDCISIINYDKSKMDNERLFNIIKNNRKQKDILIKASLDEIRMNNYRIGFHLYQLENNDKVKDINKIVDENTSYLERLNAINKTVESEINRLLNK